MSFPFILYQNTILKSGEVAWPWMWLTTNTRTEEGKCSELTVTAKTLSADLFSMGRHHLGHKFTLVTQIGRLQPETPPEQKGREATLGWVDTSAEVVPRVKKVVRQSIAGEPRSQVHETINSESGFQCGESERIAISMTQDEDTMVMGDLWLTARLSYGSGYEWRFSTQLGRWLSGLSAGHTSLRSKVWMPSTM